MISKKCLVKRQHFVNNDVLCQAAGNHADPIIILCPFYHIILNPRSQILQHFYHNFTTFYHILPQFYHIFSRIHLVIYQFHYGMTSHGRNLRNPWYFTTFFTTILRFSGFRECGKKCGKICGNFTTISPHFYHIHTTPGNPDFTTFYHISTTVVKWRVYEYVRQK